MARRVRRTDNEITDSLWDRGIVTQSDLEQAERGILHFYGEVEENSLSRLWQMVEDNNRSFGIVSASRNSLSSELNNARHEGLKKFVQNSALEFIEIRWIFRKTYDDGSLNEAKKKSLLIPDIAKFRLTALGKKFKQNEVIYKSNEGVYFIDVSPIAEKVEYELEAVENDLRLTKDFLKVLFGFDRLIMTDALIDER